MWMFVWQLVARFVLCVVFGAAAFAKFRDPSLAESGTKELGVSERFVGAISRALAPLEATIVLGLIFAPVVGAIIAAIVLLAFTVALGRAMAGGKRPRCFCFGAMSAAPAGPEALVRNVVLVALAVVVLVAR